MTSIRSAVSTDLAAVAALEAQIFADAAWSRGSVEEEFAGLGATRSVFVAVEAGRVVGYAVLLALGDGGDLTRVAVEVARREAGVGSRLVDAAVRHAQELGLRRLLLEVAESNAPALALYDKRGFEPIDRRAAYYADGSDALVMCKTLDHETGEDGS